MSALSSVAERKEEINTLLNALSKSLNHIDDEEKLSRKEVMEIDRMLAERLEVIRLRCGNDTEMMLSGIQTKSFVHARIITRLLMKLHQK